MSDEVTLKKDDWPDITISMGDGDINIHIDTDETAEIVSALENVIAMLLDAEGERTLH